MNCTCIINSTYNVNKCELPDNGHLTYQPHTQSVCQKMEKCLVHTAILPNRLKVQAAAQYQSVKLASSFVSGRLPEIKVHT